MQSFPREEIVVIDAEFNGHVGEGKSLQKQMEIVVVNTVLSSRRGRNIG